MTLTDERSFFVWDAHLLLYVFFSLVFLIEL